MNFDLAEDGVHSGALFARVLADPAAYCKAIRSQSQCGQRGLVVTVEPQMPRQAHQIVGHHDEAEGGFRGPEVLQAERVKSAQ